MSMLIKGLDIPKGEHERITVQIGSNGDVYLVTDFELKAEVYKFNAVEVPEPHGRLIEADDLITAFPANEAGADVKIASVRGTILHAPTVIEAEGEHD